MKNQLTITGMFLMLFMVSCSSGSDDDDPIINPPPTTITYANTISAIISGHCTGCHGNPTSNGAPMSLTTYASVKEAVENRGLINKIETGAMPKTGGMLSATQIQNFKTWQTNGFPQ